MNVDDGSSASVSGGALGWLEEADQGSFPANVALIAQGIQRARSALAGPLCDEQRVRIRNRARAFVAELDLPHLKAVQVEMSILVQDAERAIALASVPGSSGRPAKGQEECVFSDHTIPPPGMSREVVRQLRSLHTRLTGEQFAEIGQQARASGTLLTRRAVKRELDALAGKGHESRDDEPPAVPAPTRSPMYKIEEAARRAARDFVRRHDVVACAVVVYTEPGGEPIVGEESLYGAWRVRADLERVPGTESGPLPLAPDDRVAYWQDLMCLAGEWMRRPEPSSDDRRQVPGPLGEDAARRRAYALYRNEFGRGPDEDGLAFNAGFEPASVGIRERARRRFREYWEGDRGAPSQNGASRPGWSDSDADDFLTPCEGAPSSSRL